MTDKLTFHVTLPKSCFTAEGCRYLADELHGIIMDGLGMGPCGIDDEKLLTVEMTARTDHVWCDTCDQWVHKDKITDCRLAPCGLHAHAAFDRLDQLSEQILDENGPEIVCPKCGCNSGDDWSQCRGSCPIPSSPHYKPVPAEQQPVPIGGGPMIKPPEVVKHPQTGSMLATGDTEATRDLLQSLLSTSRVGSELATEVLRLRNDVADLTKRNAELSAECLASMTEIGAGRARAEKAEARVRELAFVAGFSRNTELDAECVDVHNCVPEQFRNVGSSLGLEYDYIFGKLPRHYSDTGREVWCVWNRHTGEIVYRAAEDCRPDQSDIFNKNAASKECYRLCGLSGFPDADVIAEMDTQE